MFIGNLGTVVLFQTYSFDEPSAEEIGWKYIINSGYFYLAGTKNQPCLVVDKPDLIKKWKEMRVWVGGAYSAIGSPIDLLELGDRVLIPNKFRKAHKAVNYVSSEEFQQNWTNLFQIPEEARRVEDLIFEDNLKRFHLSSPYTPDNLELPAGKKGRKKKKWCSLLKE